VPFRLAEVRCKQDCEDEAIQLYQRLLTKFSSAALETKIAMENHAAIGGKALDRSLVIAKSRQNVTSKSALATHFKWFNILDKYCF
jgi:hypothetical protein